MQPRAPVTQAETTSDKIFGGKLHVFQPRRGHRAGTDAVLLAAACPPAARIADLGAGVGTIGLRAAQIYPDAEVMLIEQDSAVMALAERNIAENGLCRRVTAILADATARGFALPHPCDVVLTNPPFDEAGTVRRSPQPLRAAAHVLAGGIDGWISAATRCLTANGWLVIIHRADALSKVLAALNGRFGNIAILPVHSRADDAATRVLIAGRRGSKAPLRLMPPLVLHQTNGQFTPEADAIHRGVASIPLVQQTR